MVGVFNWDGRHQSESSLYTTRFKLWDFIGGGTQGVVVVYINYMSNYGFVV